ncbi:hypothetical protein C0989_006836 [Termitomyces sp. Mn162]|nr:hypothetical protein C0989_006836 [Termitomyces sp. Mn162]
MQVNNEHLHQLQTIIVLPAVEVYDRWYAPTADNRECFQVLLQIQESRGHYPLDVAKWLHYSEADIFTHLLHQPAEEVRAALAPAEEPVPVALSTSAAPTKEGPLLLVASATTNPASSSGASSEDTPSKKSIELDYINNSALTTNAQLAMTLQVVPSPMEVVVATNIATPTASEARSSGPSDIANAVLEC